MNSQKMEPEISLRIRTRAISRRIPMKDVIFRSGINRGTFWNRMKDGNWNRNQLISLDHVIGFEEEDLDVILGREQHARKIGGMR